MSFNPEKKTAIDLSVQQWPPQAVTVFLLVTSVALCNISYFSLRRSFSFHKPKLQRTWPLLVGCSRQLSGALAAVLQIWNPLSPSQPEDALQREGMGHTSHEPSDSADVEKILASWISTENILGHEVRLLSTFLYILVKIVARFFGSSVEVGKFPSGEDLIRPIN